MIGDFTTLRKLCVLLRCTRQTDLTKLCQTAGGKWRRCELNKAAPHSECKRTYRNKVASVHGPLKHLKLAVASTRVALNGNILLITTFSTVVY